MKSSNTVYNEIKTILYQGISLERLTKEEADEAIKAFKVFAIDYPDHKFLSKKERYEQNIPLSPEETALWNRIQPILDKAQVKKCKRKSPK